MAKKQYNFGQPDQTLKLEHTPEITNKVRSLVADYIKTDWFPKWPTTINYLIEAIQYDGTHAGTHFMNRYATNLGYEMWNVIFDTIRYINKIERLTDDKKAEKTAEEAHKKYQEFLKTLT